MLMINVHIDQAHSYLVTREFPLFELVGPACSLNPKEKSPGNDVVHDFTVFSLYY